MFTALSLGLVSIASTIAGAVTLRRHAERKLIRRRLGLAAR